MMAWTLLIAGIALWCAAHLFKRLAPAPRARLGDRGKALFAVLIVASVVLMVIGYRGAEGAIYWGRSPALVGITSLLMILAFYVYAVGGPKGDRIWLGTKLRHPQLVGFSLWAVAHLLVNGDAPSFVLFGGLLAWALGSVFLINAQDGPWTPPNRAPKRKELIYIIAALVVTAVVMVIHNWLGVQPWG
ncbi:MAG: NnrU family protein [Roseicyclus sp.]|nr:NnrU family protein [Roseicyclus sp.]